MKKQQKKKPVKYIILILLLAVIAVAGVWTAFHIKEGRKETTTVISKTTLEKVLDISELSTGKAVYHGIAHVCMIRKMMSACYTMWHMMRR